MAITMPLAQAGPGLFAAVPVVRPATAQTPISYDSSVASSAFAADTRVIEITATTACHFTLGSSPTATTNDTYLPADQTRYYRVDGGEKIAFIKVSGGSAGVAYVTECN